MTVNKVAEVSAQYLATNLDVVSDGYKQSDAGAIPLDWWALKIDDLATVIRGASPRPKGDKRYYGGTVPRLMVEDVTRDGKFVTPSVDSLTEAGAKLSRPCPQGTLTLVCSGTVGVPSILAVDACIHDGFLALVKVSKKVSVDYLFHFFSTQREKFNNSATHGGVFTNLTTEGVKEFLVALPSRLDEQTAIANALSDVDALISELEKLIAKKQDIKTATMQQLLTGRTRLPQFALREDGSKKGYKQSELGEIPEDWDVFCIGDVAEVRMCKRIMSYQTAKVGEIPFFKIGTFGSEPDAYISSALYREFKDKYSFPEKGDILISAAGTLGKTVIYDGIPSYFQDSNIVWLEIDKRRVLNSYLYHYYRVIKWSSSEGSTISRLYNGIIKASLIVLPTVQEQTAIATILSDMDSEIQALQQRLSKTRQIKQGMMQELLTGKTRLIQPAGSTN